MKIKWMKFLEKVCILVIVLAVGFLSVRYYKKYQSGPKSRIDQIKHTKHSSKIIGMRQITQNSFEEFSFYNQRAQDMKSGDHFDLVSSINLSNSQQSECLVLQSFYEELHVGDVRNTYQITLEKNSPNPSLCYLFKFK